LAGDLTAVRPKSDLSTENILKPLIMKQVLPKKESMPHMAGMDQG